MAKEYVYLSGKGRWVKLFTPSQWNKYSLELNPDNPSLSIILDLKKRGIRNTIKKDDEGYWISLSRPSEISVKGQKRAMEPPAVTDNSDPPNPWNKDKAIGNGSDIVCKVHVREYTVPLTGNKGLALRLEAVKVVTLAPYERDSWPNPKQIDGLAEQTMKPF